MPAKIKVAATNPAAAIGELVEKLIHLRELRNLTEAAPRNFEEAAADIARVVEALALRCEPQVAWLAQSPAGFADVAHQLSHPESEYAQIPPASLLAWMQPDALAAALKRDLQASYDSMPVPMSSAAKHAELNRLDREIKTIETELATVWWAAIDAGLTLDPPPVSGAVLVGLSDS